MNASSINIPTQTGAEQEVPNKEAQELLMKTHAGLSAFILAVMAPGQEDRNRFLCQPGHFVVIFHDIFPERGAAPPSKVWN